MIASRVSVQSFRSLGLASRRSIAISAVKGRQIIDSRGNPTVEVTAATAPPLISSLAKEAGR
jgi:hypothetical protein